jgi:hypothetical protein
MSDTSRSADLDRALAAASSETDRDIAASGAAFRVSAAVFARISPRPARRARWVAIAATLILAAGLGSIADLTLLSAAEDSGQSVVLLDPMVFGPTEVDAE